MLILLVLARLQMNEKNNFRQTTNKLLTFIKCMKFVTSKIIFEQKCKGKN